jgi:uncharacterized protein (DUF362 family)/Pyruvate/2-oxoacid:ferredoxin oxidoreductase delta subunit
MNKKVGIEKCAEYDVNLVYQALSKAVEIAGDFDVREKKVLLKPNILFDTAPEKALTTHPVFLEAVIKLVKEKGATKIFVGDSPGIQKPNFRGKNCGLGIVAEKMGTEWVDFTKGKAELSYLEGKIQKSFSVGEILNEIDCVISLPKLKTHQLMLFTGAMKNLFGLIPSLAKSPYHVRYPKREDFASMIVDLNLAVKPVFAFMDGIVGMEGPGPGSGYPKQVGLVFASSNLLALDAAACEIIGYPAHEIPINKEALARKYWLNDFSEIDYCGVDINSLKIRDFEKIPLKKKSKNQLLELIFPRFYRKLMESKTPRPIIQHEICVRCGDCTRICSSKAMSFLDGKDRKEVHINYKKCIRCYCCHEICPVKAIEIKP